MNTHHLDWLPRLVDGAVRWLRFSERSVGPVADLVIRLALAQVFFVSGVLKLADWDTALYLAEYEYPLDWLDPVTSAWLGTGVELVGAAFLAAGLAARAGALALMVLALVIQFTYKTLDVHLFWAVLLLGVVARGAGPLSLDRLLAKGLADSAVPLAAGFLARLGLATRLLVPGYLLTLRLWLAGAVFLAGTGSAFLPATSAFNFASPFATACAGFLALGLATRPAALVLLLGISGAHMMAGGATEDGWWLLALVIPLLWGAGPFSLDGLIEHGLRRRFPQLAGKPAFDLETVPRAVIVGAGFGGLACALALTRARVAVTLIDRNNYHLFQPLLYQVATAGLSPGDIATPVRGLFREHFNVRVLYGEVTSVDKANKRVLVGDQAVPYDYLVLATGASHSYFGRDDWAPFAPGLKRVEDAAEIRRRILSAFEAAEATADEAERRRLLTFLVVGGGPTGVELAGAIAELARHGMDKEFRRFDPATARVLLVQSGPRVLPTFPERLSEATRVSLERLGVEVLLDSRVEEIDAGGVTVSGERVVAGTVLWAAGVVASPAARWLGAEADRAGRVKVGPDLAVPGQADVFAIGDTALAEAWNGGPVPGLAPAAKQGGHYVARVIRARLEGRAPPPPFRYRHLGSLSTIGRKSAVADFNGLRITGALAWWLWGAVHVGFLLGMRNRISVMWDWFWAYLTYRGGTRLITGEGASREAV